MNIRVGQNAGAVPVMNNRIVNGASKRRPGMAAGALGRSNNVKSAGLQQLMNNPYGKSKENSIREKQRKITSQSMEVQDYAARIAQESANYAQTLSTARTASRKTETQVKKVRYNYKAISSQILRSKTSLNAKQVAGKAKRMVMQLKRQKSSGEYDKDEMELAIAHAESMERVARKRARHLQEEEMVKVTGGVCEGELEDKELKEEEDFQVDEHTQELTSEMEEATGESIEQVMEEIAEVMEEYQRISGESTDEMMAEYQEMLEEAMKELMEESGLSELADEMFSETDPEMDPEDYRMMKLKHRISEMKAIAKADSVYLKALFDKFQEDKGKGVMPSVGSGPTGMGAVAGGLGALGFHTGMPESVTVGEYAGGIIDVGL